MKPAHQHTEEHHRRVVCVTGSAKRIGAAIIKHMHAEGYEVVIHCHQSLDAATALANELNLIRQQSAQVVQADLCDMNDLPRLADDILHCFGRVDVLVHNASRFYPTPLNGLNNLATSTQQASPIDNHSAEKASLWNTQWQHAWDELFASNAKAPFFLTYLLKDTLAKHHGSVISLLDIHAHDRPFPSYTIYNMAKAAHRMMVKSLSLELAPHVRVNGIAPGANIWPDEHSDQAIHHYTQDMLSQTIPLKRVGDPNDIADAVAYLANASYVTGHIVDVDGGRSLTLAGG